MSDRRMIRVWTAVAAGVLMLAGSGQRPADAGSCAVPLFAHRTGAVILSDQGHATRVRVEIADTPQLQEIGLMCRNALEPDAGMLFVFPASTREQFWMKNTLIPLTIAFIDANWHIVGIVDMPVAPDPTSDDPSKFPLYGPQKPYRYALEVNAGFFKEHEISERAEVRYMPP